MRTLRLRFVLVPMLSFALAACGGGLGNLLESDKVEYKNAGKLQPLEIPPDLTRPSASDTFVVPDGNAKGPATYSAYNKERAPGAAPAAILLTPEGVRLERNGSQRWLVVKGDSGAVWNTVRDYWQDAGFILFSENPEAGVMETDWAESRPKLPDDNKIRGMINRALGNTRITTAGPVGAGERVKFRTRLERGTDPGTMEIYISHRGMLEAVAESSSSPSVWKAVPSDPGLEAEMLSRLMARFGVKQEQAKVDTSAKVAATVERATLRKAADGSGTLSVDDQFDRAWRRVGLALDRVGFTVEDRDRSKGIYFVRYVDSDVGDKNAQSKDFFSKLNPFSKSEKPPSREQYRIEVKDADTTSQINVLSKDGAREKSDAATRILSLLYEQLK